MAARRPSANRRVLAVLALVAVVLATVGALFASAWPDGLEAVAERTGIAGRARNLLETPLADYEARFAGASWLGKALAGAAGVALVAGALMAVQRLIARRGSA